MWDETASEATDTATHTGGDAAAPGAPALARERLSAFVISYNRAPLLRTCLKALSFADEIVVVDKSSTDDSVAVAAALADRVTRVPWSPTVEETRAFALSQCSHDWVLCLDDDECLSAEAVRAIDRALHAPQADIYLLPLRHYILGRHDERAYYWPEHHPRLFRRGAVSFGATVHGGTTLLSARRQTLAWERGACIHHLSHRDTAEWIAKTNRYTSQPDRAAQDWPDGVDLAAFAHARIDAWAARGRGAAAGDDYPAAVAVLRAVYDIVDRLKHWEAAAGVDGEGAFAGVRQALEVSYQGLADLARPRRPAPPAPAAGGDAAEDAVGEDMATRAAQLAAELAAIRASTAWRITAPLRALAERRPAVARLARRAARRGTPAVSPVSPPLPEREPAAAEIAFPAVETPVASIIVPTYGQVPFTLRCLAALARAGGDVPAEIILVDDASPDPAAAALAGVRGVTLLRNAANLGYLASCNAAARRARGEFLLFLNNDTEPQPGFLDALVGLLRRRPDAGMAGSKLLSPDRTLQEAGGIIWQDGRGWTYGRGDDPARARYEYVREVDYVSGASLMIRRALFRALGGFDPLFSPAYCEDSDLAFRVRAAGLKVLYQPASVVVHHEGATNGRDPAAGVKRFNDINQAKLRARWAAELAAQYPHGSEVPRAAERGRDRPLVLVAAERPPDPGARAADRPAARALRHLLRAGAMVKLWSPPAAVPTPSLPTSREHAAAWRQRGVEVLDDGALQQWLAGDGAGLDLALVCGAPAMAAAGPALRTALSQAPGDGAGWLVYLGATDGPDDAAERSAVAAAASVLRPAGLDEGLAALLDRWRRHRAGAGEPRPAAGVSPSALAASLRVDRRWYAPN